MASGGLFDSWDSITWGRAIIYWLGAPEASVAASLADTLVACETLLYFVAAVPPAALDGRLPMLLDRASELRRAFGANGPLAIVVDASGRVAALLPAPAPDGVAAMATRLYMESTPAFVQAKAPVLLLERVAEPALCQSLVEYWRRGDKTVNVLSGENGNVVNTDVKRRQDVQLEHPGLFVELRDCLVRRVVPVIAQAFHTRIMVIETPIVGCYDADSGGWFRRHRDNTSRHTAHVSAGDKIPH